MVFVSSPVGAPYEVDGLVIFDPEWVSGKP
jgi:hypothetical protein